MARPRRLTDEQLIAAAAQAIVAREGSSWSLADVAERCDMSPAALVKRFGSKQDLLRRVAKRWVDGLPPYAADPDVNPVDVVRTYVDEWASALADPATARGHFLLLADEVSDSAARGFVAAGQARQAEFLRLAFEDARRRGLLRFAPGVDPASLILDLLTGGAVRAALGRADPESVRVPIHQLLNTWRTP